MASRSRYVSHSHEYTNLTEKPFRSTSPARDGANGDSTVERISVKVPSVPRPGDNDIASKRRERELELERINKELGTETTTAAQKKDDGRAEMAKLALTVGDAFGLCMGCIAEIHLQRGGGTYIPPHRMRAMMAEQAQQDPASVEYQRMTWEALRKSINGLINKVRYWF